MTDASDTSREAAAGAPLTPGVILEGIRVVEVSQNLAGPWCGRILAGLGASVVKVEPPAGDAARSWGPPFVHGHGTLFSLANPDKRSLTLDLRDPRGMDVLRRLVGRSDVLLEALRPGALTGLGMGWDDARALNPRLIYASVMAYGEEGPLAGLPGYEPLMQAQAGLMSCTGEPDGPPVRVGTSVVDLGTGMWAALAVLAALMERERTGRGRRVSAALWDTALVWSGYHLLAALGADTVAGRHGSELPMICPYGAFPTLDGRVMVAAANDGLFGRLCEALGLGDVATDPRFATNPLRVEHRTELNARVAEGTSVLSSADLLERLRVAGVPCAPIQDMAGVRDDPQTRASGLVTEVSHGAGGSPAPALTLPLRFDGARAPVRRAPPEAGGDADSILEELGLSRDDIRTLRRDGVI